MVVKSNLKNQKHSVLFRDFGENKGKVRTDPKYQKIYWKCILWEFSSFLNTVVKFNEKNQKAECPLKRIWGNRGKVRTDPKY